MIDYERLEVLNLKVKNNTATQAEKDEYMLLLYRNQSITKSQYDKYLDDKTSSDGVIGTAVTIGGILLLGYLINKLIGSNN